MGHPSPKYTAEFKQRAAGLYRERGCAYAGLAREPGCDAGSISDRVERAGAAGAAPDRNPFQMAGEPRGPRRGNDRPRTESGMLLKASALFASRQLQGRPRRGPSSRSYRPTGAPGGSRTCARRSGRPGGAATPGGAGGRAPAMDIWPGRAVGWSMSDRVGAGPADEAPEMAIARRRPPAGRIHRSEHGSRYVSLRPGRTMGENGIGPSMGAISPPWDNAAMESLMGPVRAGCVHARTFESREQAALEIFEYIECLYDRVRTHSALGCLGPEEFEARNRKGAAKAA